MVFQVLCLFQGLSRPGILNNKIPGLSRVCANPYITWLQVSRIFIANILRARAAVANRQRADVIDDTYLLTSDADIWPIYGAVYRLTAAHDVLSLNSDCCGAFSHRNVAYRMLPMANVGMRVRTWRRLTRRCDYIHVLFRI